MTDTGMYTFMSSCQRDEWNSQLMSDTCPEITPTMYWQHSAI